MIVTDDKHVDLSKIHVSVAQIETICDRYTVQQFNKMWRKYSGALARTRVTLPGW